MRKWLGDGKLIAAAILAAGVAMVAVPAFGDSGGGATTTAARSAAPKGVPFMPPPAPPALNGAAREKLDKAAKCMRSHAADIPGAKSTAHGFFIGPDVPRSAVAKAAKECGAPPPPPRGALLPPPMGMPGARAKMDGAVTRCLHAQAKR